VDPLRERCAAAWIAARWRDARNARESRRELRAQGASHRVARFRGVGGRQARDERPPLGDLRAAAGARGLDFWRSCVAFAERALHQHLIEPFAELPTGGTNEAGSLEAKRAVQGDRWFGRAVADDRDHLAVALAEADGDQFG